MQLSRSEGEFSASQNYCAYLNIIEIPKSIMLNLKLVSPLLFNPYQESFNPSLCYLKIYKDIIFTIVKNIETVITKQKVELLKELINIEARKNIIKQFQDKTEYVFLIQDIKWDSKQEDEQSIRIELKQLEQFYLSIHHLVPQKITS